jgi:hypothetical protein
MSWGRSQMASGCARQAPRPSSSSPANNGAIIWLAGGDSGAVGAPRRGALEQQSRGRSAPPPDNGAPDSAQVRLAGPARQIESRLSGTRIGRLAWPRETAGHFIDEIFRLVSGGPILRRAHSVGLDGLATRRRRERN